jgi:hypothetical protein
MRGRAGAASDSAGTNATWRAYRTADSPYRAGGTNCHSDTTAARRSSRHARQL